MRRMFQGISLALLLSGFYTFPGWAAERFIAASVSPQGLVRDARQIGIRFSMPVVDFGDPRDRVVPVADPC